MASLGLSRSYHERAVRDRAPWRNENRGRGAERPADIPARGWKDILWRTWERSSVDNIAIVAAGVAYSGLFALFPAVAALVSVYGLVADPASIEAQFNQLSGILPGDALTIVRDQAQKVASSSSSGLSVGVIAGFGLTLWSVSAGIRSLIAALDIAYDEEERRGFFTLLGLSVVATVAGLVFTLFTLALVVAVPAVSAALGLEGPLAWAVSLARWPILAAALLLVLAVLYRYGPSRAKPRWEWVSPGALAATALWLIGSAAFSFYIANFGRYNETYGSVGAAAVLLLWFNLSAYVVLMGAELNAEVERQTARDSTTGRSKPLGRRRANAADTVGEAKG